MPGIEQRTIETNVPAGLDRLPFSGWHRKIIVALGTSWLLDGLQVTLAGSWAGVLDDKEALCFSAIFFASSAASAAYLTVSEIFPLEVRALAIAIFCAIGTLIGGVGAPYLFGALIASGSRWNVAYAYRAGAAPMMVGAIAEWAVGVEAAGKSLESISQPLQSES